MSDNISCNYCGENKFEKLKAIKIIYQWENPEAHGYPEIAYWNKTYDIDYCPICGRKIREGKRSMNELMWYRFKTHAEDYRPLIDMKDIQMPWWCTGYSSNDDAIIVCYLPKDEDLFKYWDDAFDIDSEERTEITYTDRFPKPDWL